MKKIFRAALLASTLSLAAAAAQDSNSSAPQPKQETQAAEKSAKQQRPKSGTDCSNRPGARCNKPKQRKPWFFGKA